ncbi:hypothetical protein [Sphingomonas sp.]|uniref:hypothetical protein n=1 Tax=Sphingomonas sp. TaxID=28214 RepID=UPI002FDB04A5
MKKFLGLLAVSAVSIMPAAAQERHDGHHGGNHGGRWRSVGLQMINGKGDRDIIRVRGERRDRQIRVCSVNHPFRLREVAIRFANGGRQDVGVRERIEGRACTRPIDLRGERRNIEQVGLTYSAIGSGRIPLVRVEAR